MVSAMRSDEGRVHAGSNTSQTQPQARATHPGAEAADSGAAEDRQGLLNRLSRRFDRVAERAVDNTLVMLDCLAAREDSQDQDRGARSAESLMRVASSAITLRAQLERLAREDGRENAPKDNDTDAAEAARFVAKYTDEINRLEGRIAKSDAAIAATQEPRTLARSLSKGDPS